jgi:hypothetical protein
MLLNDWHVSLRRSLPVILLTLGLITSTGLVILSPLVLTALARLKINWLQLSNVGQTYGAVSALFSSFAVAGVVVSLLYQSRDNRNAREQTTRTLQFELIKMAMADPDIMTAGGAPWDLNIPSDSSSIRQFLYVQLWVSFLGGNFTIGELPESAVRYIAVHEIFRSEAGRNYWTAVGRVQIDNSEGPRKRFLHILDEEYQKIILTGIPPARPVSSSPRQPSASATGGRKRIQQLCEFTAVAAIGILAGRFCRVLKR